MGRSKAYSKETMVVIRAEHAAGVKMTNIITKHPELKLSYGGLRKAVVKLSGKVAIPAGVRKKRVRTEAKVQEAAAALEANPYTSITDLAKEIGVSKKVGVKMLDVDLDKKCYECVGGQALNEKQESARAQMRQGWKDAIASGKLRTEDIWFPDEKFFRQTGGTKAPQNHRVWVSKNARKRQLDGLKVIKPQSKKMKGVMISLAVNMSACTLPCFMKPGVKIDASYYISTLEDHFVPEITYRHTTPRPWVWQQDNAPSHTSGEAKEWIGKHIGTVSSGRVINFPPNSPDLSPLDFAAWDRLQKAVDQEKCKTQLDIRVALKKHCGALMGDKEYLKKVCSHWEKRMEKCIEAQGGHFEHKMD